MIVDSVHAAAVATLTVSVCPLRPQAPATRATPKKDTIAKRGGTVSTTVTTTKMNSTSQLLPQASVVATATTAIATTSGGRRRRASADGGRSEPEERQCGASSTSATKQVTNAASARAESHAGRAVPPTSLAAPARESRKR